ncbi:SIR2 family protein [Pediococcus pentosaceus]|uniref:SIR2 family protein n=1 Tax=Pediococcus pentosaceus TaxID=1255 RepID=UPI003C2DE4B6
MITSRKSFIEQYSKAINEGYAAVFAGAGLSVASGYVDWKTLVTPLAEELNLNIEEENDLTKVAQYYRNEFKSRGDINQTIMEAFSKEKEPNENIDILTRLPIYTYWTTNYDKLLEEGFKNNNRKVDVKCRETRLSTQKYDRDAILYKMHGDVDDPAEAVLTKQDYEIYNQRNPLFTSILQGDLISKTFLFIGFSFEDPNLTNVLAATRNILDENISNNYWLEKRVTKPSDIEESTEAKVRYEVDRTKQELKIHELQRYGIQTVYIDSYEEITEILKELEFLNLKRKIFISGSVTFYDKIWTKEKVNALCYSLAKELVKNNYQICSRFGYGVGSSVINGALEVIYSEKYKHVDDYLNLRPFPQNNSSVNQGNDVRQKMYRSEMVNGVGVVIFMFGNREGKDKKEELSEGLIEEFRIAKKQGKKIIPIGSTGGATKKIFEEVENNIIDYPYFKKTFINFKE